MGLFTALLTLPLAPVRGVVWVAEQVSDEVGRQMYDEEAIAGELLQLELDADDGRIDEAHRAVREEELLDRLAVARTLREDMDLRHQEGWIDG